MSDPERSIWSGYIDRGLTLGDRIDAAAADPFMGSVASMVLGDWIDHPSTSGEFADFADRAHNLLFQYGAEPLAKDVYIRSLAVAAARRRTANAADFSGTNAGIIE